MSGQKKKELYIFTCVNLYIYIYVCVCTKMKQWIEIHRYAVVGYNSSGSNSRKKGIIGK